MKANAELLGTLKICAKAVWSQKGPKVDFPMVGKGITETKSARHPAPPDMKVMSPSQPPAKESGERDAF